jgi:putative nucleotidyltransferase with HDIG domain
MDKSSEFRRQEVRRQRNELRETLWERMTRWISPSALLIWVGFYVAAVAILLWGHDSMPWRLGQRIDQDITARVEFDVEDIAETEQERHRARESAPFVYQFNAKSFTDKVAAAVTSRLHQLVEKGAASQPAIAGAGLPRLDSAARQALQAYAGESGQERFAELTQSLLKKLEDKYIVNSPGRSGVRPPISIIRRDDRPDRKVINDQLILVSDRAAVEKAMKEVAGDVLPKPLQPTVAEILTQAILGSKDEKSHATPLYEFDGWATTREQKALEEAVPVKTVNFKPGDTLVSASKNIGSGSPSKGVLNDENLLLLRREHEKFLEQQRTNPVLRRQLLLTEIGMAGVVLLVTFALVVYTLLYQRKVFYRPGRALGVVCLLLAMTLLTRLNERAQYPLDLPVEFSVCFVVIATALLTIAYDQRLALGVSGNLAILATLASRGDFGLFVTMLSAMGIVIFSLREVRTRSKVVLVGFASGVAAFLASGSTGLIAGQELQYVLVHALAAGGAAVAAGFIVQGILPNFERLFGVATSITLLEWSDASRPLLRRLAQEAPGTYSHSLVLSQMAEEAANAIGANGLLARVGALYHDVGKITKAEYFVENQEARMNRHERLSPTMSLLIIVGHVKDGIEMAREYGLPRVLHHFIAEHHGTTVVKFFHHAARELAARKHDREVPDTEFRYPGPKPRSKETAILMLCDGCEGAVRALMEPTPGRIESTVHQVMMDRLTDGQFDECDITLRELHLIEQSLVKSLGAIHHGRIKYPKAAAEESGAAGEGRDEGRAAPLRTGEVARQA